MVRPPERIAGDGGNDSSSTVSKATVATEQKSLTTLVLTANAAGTGDTTIIATSVGGVTTALWARRARRQPWRSPGAVK